MQFDVEARFYEKLPDGKIRCQLCPRACLVGEGERGHCGVRENRGGTYYLLVHSRVCAANVDPVEKKPLFHFLPGKRFRPVISDEVSKLEYEISVLSPLRRVQDVQEIEVGRHGLLIKNGGSEGILLPQVAMEQHWDHVTFLEQTCVKAGLPENCWKDEETDIFLFTAEVFGEQRATASK